MDSRKGIDGLAVLIEDADMRATYGEKELFSSYISDWSGKLSKPVFYVVLLMVMDLVDTAQSVDTVQHKLVAARQAGAHQNEQLEIQRETKNANREKLTQLLESARKNIEANRLILPASNNALKDYRAILAIEPKK